MFIWFAMLIPVATATFLFLAYQHRTTWWELILPLLASFLFCLGAKSTIEYYQFHDIEYWTGWALKAEYYEAWTETWTTTDKDGHTSTHTTYHSPEWYVYDSNDLKISISRHDYNRLATLWGNNSWSNLFHLNQSSWGDGDMYTTQYDRKHDVVVTSRHSYANKVAHSDSVFNFPVVDPNTFKLFRRPDHHLFNTVCLQGCEDRSADLLLQKANAEIGHLKQVRMLILVFHNQPVQAAVEQQAFWKNGNKNEIVLCIGANGNKIDWAYVFSWSESEDLKVGLKENVMKMDFDLPKIIDYMKNECKAKFVRKKFADFNYIIIEPPWWAVLITYILTGGLNFGLSCWIINNEHN